MDPNTQLALLEILDACRDESEKHVIAYVRKVFAARRGGAPLPEPGLAHNEYRDFTQKTMPQVRADFPRASPQERMRIVAQLWKLKK